MFVSPNNCYNKVCISENDENTELVHVLWVARGNSFSHIIKLADNGNSSTITCCVRWDMHVDSNCSLLDEILLGREMWSYTMCHAVVDWPTACLSRTSKVCTISSKKIATCWYVKFARSCNRQIAAPIPFPELWVTFWASISGTLCPLMDKMKMKQMGATLAFLTNYHNEGPLLIICLATGDKTWAHHYTLGMGKIDNFS